MDLSLSILILNLNMIEVFTLGTVMKIKRYRDTGGGIDKDSSSIFIEKRVQVTIDKGENRYVAVNLGHNKYDLRTLHITNDKEIEAVTTIFDKKTDGTQIYKSLRETKTYDILAIPCEDKDGSTYSHVYVENKGNKAAVFTVIIKAISLY
ncbi:hypothetical protein BAMA111019_20255 [Bacillus manliponensis]